VRNIKIAPFVTVIFILVSCTKGNNVASTDKGTWTLGSTQYNIVATHRSNLPGYFILTGNDPQSPANILYLYFASIPTSSGQFDVVQFNGNVQLSSSQIGIKVNIPSTGIYSSTGISDNITWSASSPANLTVQNGKIEVKIPKMTTVIITSTYLDTVFVQGLIKE
jgi:hypothetical protein